MFFIYFLLCFAGNEIERVPRRWEESGRRPGFLRSIARKPFELKKDRERVGRSDGRSAAEGGKEARKKNRHIEQPPDAPAPSCISVACTA